MRKLWIGLVLVSLTSCTFFLHESNLITEQKNKMEIYQEAAKSGNGLCFNSFDRFTKSSYKMCYFASEYDLRLVNQQLDDFREELVKMQRGLNTEEIVTQDGNREFLKSIRIIDDNDEINYKLCIELAHQEVLNSLNHYYSYLKDKHNDRKRIYIGLDKSISVIKNWLSSTGTKKEKEYIKDITEDTESYLFFYKKINEWKDRINQDIIESEKGNDCLTNLKKYLVKEGEFNYQGFCSDPITQSLLVNHS